MAERFDYWKRKYEKIDFVFQWHELDRNVQQKYYDMARDERMKHMQMHPGWSARDNYGTRKKRGSKGKKREKNPGENGGNAIQVNLISIYSYFLLI